MRIGAINSSDKFIANNTNFKATFIENEFSKELRSVSSKEDIDLFEKACVSLSKAKRDTGYYSLDGVTINNGMAGESEIDDKFIKLTYKLDKHSPLNSIRMWVLRCSECVSGGYAKKDVLKEVAGQLEKYAAANVNRRFI